MTTTTRAARCGFRTAGSDRVCPDPPANLVLVGCVHEHMYEAKLCHGHLQNLNDGATACITCYRLPVDSHRCRILGRVMA